MTKTTKKPDTTLATVSVPTSVPMAAVRAQLNNDWSGVSDQDKVKYCLALCKSLDIPTPLNPFKFIKLKGKDTLYAPKEAAELLAERNKLSVNITNKYLDRDSNIYVVEVRASTRDGRTIDNLAAMSMAGATGEDRCNRMMKCVSKATRRVVFSSVGLSVIDDDDKAAIERDASCYATPPAIPPSNVPPITILEGMGEAATSEEQELATEAVAARAELITSLCGKDGMFGPKKIKQAKEWIEEVAAKPYEMLTPNDCQELMSMSMREPGADEDEDLELPLEQGNDRKK